MVSGSGSKPESGSPPKPRLSVENVESGAGSHPSDPPLWSFPGAIFGSDGDPVWNRLTLAEEFNLREIQVIEII
jgi:hypothetical protein